jgi:DNA repair exonuclease SbcCD ATPase subunit
MKAKAAEAAEAYARETGRLEQVQAELAELECHKIELEQQIERLRRDAESLPEAREELKHEIAQLQREESTLEDELLTLRAERGLLFAAREEMAALTSRSAQVQQELESLQRELEQLPTAHLELKLEIEQLQAVKSGIREELPALRREVVSARDEVSDMAARKAALEVEIERLSGEASGGTSEEDELDDLRRRPLCLPVVGGSARPTQQERDALGDVIQSKIQRPDHPGIPHLPQNQRHLPDDGTCRRLWNWQEPATTALCRGHGAALPANRRRTSMGQSAGPARFLQLRREALP